MNINLTLFGQAISFALFTWFCFKYVWPPLIGALNERQAKIAKSLQDAEDASRDLEDAGIKAKQVIKEAKEQAAILIDQANKRASSIIDDARTKALDEANRQKLAAEHEIEQQMQRARESLRASLSHLVIQGAEKVLESEIDASVHDKFLKDLALAL